MGDYMSITTQEPVMGSQVAHAVSHEATTEAPLTRRQMAARKRAEEMKAVNQAAKAWLATRKNSKTPVADRLIARHIGKGWNEAVARQTLLACLTDSEWDTVQDDYAHRPLFADSVMYNLLQHGFISNRNDGAYIKAIALMQEAGIPADYWENAAARLAAQAAKPAIGAKNIPESNELARLQAQADITPALALAA